MIRLDERSALLIVDVQNDFCPGGDLPVPDGDKIIPVLNRYIGLFSGKNIPVFASRDWHPRNSKHFKENGGLWPVHCVQGSKGAEFHPDLQLPLKTTILSKGVAPDADGYSVFQAVDTLWKKFPTIIKESNVTNLFIGGLATEYCIKNTVLDALTYGCNVVVLIDAIKGINRQEGDSKKALAEMTRAGAQEGHLASLQ